MNVPGTSGAAAVTEAVTAGACRMMRDMGYSPLREFKLSSGRRADIGGLNRRGRIAIVEVKASVADLRGDAKWRDYLAHCDCFYFAVAEDFPSHILDEACFLPERTGLIIADRFGGVVRRLGREEPMNAARRKVETLRFARRAADRLHHLSETESAPGPLFLTLR